MFLPYAEWLAVQDRFDEALEAFRKAGRPEESRKMMEELTLNAVREGRFKDAAYYYFLLGTEVLKSTTFTNNVKENGRHLKIYSDYMTKADWYYGYQHIHTFCTDPFTSLQPEMLFQVSRYLINSLSQSDPPNGISLVNILYTLAKQSKVLGAFKLARFTYDRLQQLKVPESWEDNIDLDMMTIQAKPVRDNPELAPVCYRCGSTNPLLNPFSNKFTMGDRCTNCGHPFIRSFVNFDILPLVEFFPESDVSDVKALEMLKKRDGGGGGGRSKNREDQWDEDPFNRAINITLENQDGAQAYEPVVVDGRCLLKMKREEVFCCKPIIAGMRMRFFKSMIPEIAVAVSQPCHRFFNEEDFEFVYLRDGVCPVSRLKDVGDYGSL